VDRDRSWQAEAEIATAQQQANSGAAQAETATNATASLPDKWQMWQLQFRNRN